MLSSEIGKAISEAWQRYPMPQSVTDDDGFARKLTPDTPSWYNQQAIVQQQRGEFVLEVLTRELQRDEDQLTELGMAKAHLRDNDDELIEAWVYVL